MQAIKADVEQGEQRVDKLLGYFEALVTKVQKAVDVVVKNQKDGVGGGVLYAIQNLSNDFD